MFESKEELLLLILRCDYQQNLAFNGFVKWMSYVFFIVKMAAMVSHLYEYLFIGLLSPQMAECLPRQKGVMCI